MCGHVLVFVELTVVTQLAFYAMPCLAAQGHVASVQKQLAPVLQKTGKIPAAKQFYAGKEWLEWHVSKAYRARNGVDIPNNKNILNTLHPVFGHYRLGINTADNVASGGVETAVAGVYNTLAPLT